MAKPQAWQRDRASYPFSSPIQTRFQDVDILGHINNVAMAAIFENGRGLFNFNIGFDRPDESRRWLIAGVTLSYLAEAHFPEPIEVASGIGRIGTSSWDIMSAAFQHDMCVATCVTTIVQTDPDGPSALSDAMRAKFERYRTPY